GAGTLALGASYSGGLNFTGGTVGTTANEVWGDSTSVPLENGTSLDLNNTNETVGALTLPGASISTGTGLLTANGNVTLAVSATNTSTTISGRYSTGAATRKITVADSGAPEDLILNANLEGSGRIDFDGAGTVRIGGNNS